MKILVAPCAYKGTIQASALAQAIARGIEESLEDSLKNRARPVQVKLAPVADGGDDTLACLKLALPGEFVYKTVSGPTSKPVNAAFFLLDKLAVVELAQASGIAHLQEEQLAPLQANTFGTGQIVEFAIEAGAREIVIMLGGSASTDGGSAILSALGAKFTDINGAPLLTDSTVCGGGQLLSIARIDLGPLRRKTAGIKFLIATDVVNPLLGPDGAAAIFAPQKGATREQVLYLDVCLAHFAGALELASTQKNSLRCHAGAGAAGGAGFGLALGLGAQFTSGFHWLAAKTNLSEKLEWCDLVVVAEGCLDGQSLSGKATGEILSLANAAGKKVIALPACSQLNAEQEQLFAAIIPTANSSELATLASVRRAAQLIIEQDNI